MRGHRMGGHLEIWPYHPRRRRPPRPTARVCQYARDAETHRIPPSYDAPASRRGPHFTFFLSGGEGLQVSVSSFPLLSYCPPQAPSLANSPSFHRGSANRSCGSWYCLWLWPDGNATPSMNLSCADPSNFFFTFFCIITTTPTLTI